MTIHPRRRIGKGRAARGSTSSTAGAGRSPQHAWFCDFDAIALEGYQGLTAAQWEREVQHWDPALWGWGNKTGCWTHRVRRRPLWADGRGYVGVRVDREWREIPVPQGAPAAVPVLRELLASRHAQARLIAAQGLERVGQEAHPALPDLLRALEDQDEGVRRQAEQAFFRVDQEAAERAGFDWTIDGLVRRGR